MTKRINFIIPYFGDFPNYMQLFLNSCKKNPDYNWTIITDNLVKYDYPDNVCVILTEFNKLKDKVQNKFDFPVALNSPYKFCDLKPMYGYIFPELNYGYDFWGYCDMDIILGNLNHFITEEALKYDKLFTLGHMTIMKNTEYINQLFMKKIKDREYYKKVLSSPFSFNFDEVFKHRININTIFENEGIEIWKNSSIADIYTKSSDFRRDTETGVEPCSMNYYIWNQGELVRRIYRQNRWETEEFMYIHLQKRKMRIKLSDLNQTTYKIIPNAFEDLEIEFRELQGNDNKIKKKHTNLQYFRIRTRNFITKLRRAMEK